jgi:hypothetical protein
MPIRADLRHLYRTPEAIASKRRALERAGGRFEDGGRYLGGAKCVQCGVPDRETISRGPAGIWLNAEWKWRTPLGETIRGAFHGEVRRVWIILTVAHLDHNPRNNRDENRAALCQWCHLNYDKLHHKETRQARKDAARPLLQGAV